MCKKEQTKDSSCLEVIITVSGGVADLILKPRGIAVSILDYDVEGVDEERISKDADGEECCVSRWGPMDELVAKDDWPIVQMALKARYTRAWNCPDCGRVIHISYEELAQVGSPICTDCDRHMQLL